MSGDWYEATDRTWIDVFLEATGVHADRAFVRFQDRLLTYGELRERVDRLASGLLEWGVRPGETHAIWMTNCLEFVICQWAIYRVGGTLLPLYSYYREREIAHIIADAAPSVIFTKRDLAGKADAQAVLQNALASSDEGSPRLAADSLRGVITLEDWGMPGAVPLEEIERRGEPLNELGLDFAQGRTAPLDTMNVMYTSGTTGTPKGGLSMHRNNMATVHLWSELSRLEPSDVLLCHVPLFTNFGGLYVSPLALYNGASFVVTELFDAGDSLELIEEYGVTYIPGTPEMFRMMLEHEQFRKTDVSTVTKAHIAGSYLEPELMRRIIDELAPEAMQAYGMSECGGLSTVTTASDPDEIRLHSVGRPLLNTDLEIRDPASLERVAPGETGEIWFRDSRPGSCLGKGYLGDSRETSDAITPDGSWRTGDLGFIDDDGYVFFEDRLKNMITVGGFNVYPKEIEAFLEEQDGIEAAYVVGVPDDRLGSVPAAFVVPEKSDDATRSGLLSVCRERLSSQKQPRQVWLVSRDEIPLNPSGKVHLARLNEWAVELAASEDH